MKRKRIKLPMGSSPTCPRCLERCKSRVDDSRQSGDSIRRRRCCLNCGWKYTTYEFVATEDLNVVRDWVTENLLTPIEALFK